MSTVTVSPAFFAVVDAALRRGRTFHDRDGSPGSESVIINERMAAQFFPGEEPLGKRLRFKPHAGQSSQPAPAWCTIVGISQTIRQGSTTLGGEPNAVVYLAYRQDPPTSVSLLVRSQLPPASVSDAVRHEVQALDQDQPVFTIQTLDQVTRWPLSNQQK